MIVLELPAHVECDANGCDRTEDVRLVLTGAGGFGFAPKGERPALPHWQFAMANPLGPIVARCPEHRLSVATPNPPKLITTEH